MITRLIKKTGISTQVVAVDRRQSPKPLVSEFFNMEKKSKKKKSKNDIGKIKKKKDLIPKKKGKQKRREGISRGVLDGFVFVVVF